jgi:hypothetical protein
MHTLSVQGTTGTHPTLGSVKLQLVHVHLARPAQLTPPSPAFGLAAAAMEMRVGAPVNLAPVLVIAAAAAAAARP